MSKRSSRDRFYWLAHAGFAAAAVWGAFVPYDQLLELLDLRAPESPDSDDDLRRFLTVDLDEALRRLLAQEAE